MSKAHVFQTLLTSLPTRWRLTLASFGLLAILLIALGILIPTVEEQTLLDSQAQVLTEEANTVQLEGSLPRNSQTSTSSTSAETWQQAMQDIVGNNVTSASLLSPDGRTLTTVGAKKPSSPQNSSLPVVRLAPSTVHQWLTAPIKQPYHLASDNQGKRELVVLQPLKISGYGADATLQLSESTVSTDQAVATMRLDLTFGTLIALALAAALTFPLMGLALRPLVEMEKMSSRIAAGALSLRLTEPHAQDEIGRLARAFNSMVARLEAAFTRQKRFVADVSHELRTPLTALGGSLEMLLLRADDGDEEATHRLMSGMYAEVERMQRLVADLLILTRLDEKHIKLRVEEISVSSLVEEVKEQIQGLLCGQHICYQVFPDLPPLHGDADHLRRVLLNLVENALKFTPPNGHIELAARREGASFVVLEVRDTGIGILAQDLPHVFDRFYRADPSRTRLSSPVGGSGLGLSIARELIEAHSGTIAISSLVDRGTTITVRLPVS
ncbi:MAG TPA: HAMP domain-containing sensor histidine kinase [Ktedonobacteraceae bacterium]